MSETTTSSTDCAPRPGDSRLSALVSSGQGRSTLHGNSYQLRLGLVVMLRGLQMYQKDNGFDFLIAMEDSVGKDFDDIMYHYSFGQRSTGTVCIQAKHRRNDSDVQQTEQDKSSLLTEGLLHAGWNANNSLFSIAKYFLSFLEVEQHLQTDTRTYVICTNRVLDKSLEGQFIEREQQYSEDVLQFCYDIGARCYQVNPMHTDNRLKEQLINSSLSKLGKLMANDIFKGKEMVFKKSLYYNFAGLINECVELSEDFVTEEVKFKFREVFFDEPATTPRGMFLNELRKEYKRLLKNDKLDVTKSMRSALIRIDQGSFSSALSNTESLENSLSKFYKLFVLVCQTPNEEELFSNAIGLLPKWANHELVLDKLHRLLFDAMKSATPVPIDLKFLQEMFIEIDPNKEITILKSKSKEFLSSLEQRYPHIKVKPSCLGDSKLNKFVVNKNVSGIYEYRSSLEVDVSSCVVAQTLSLHQYEALFLDNASYHDRKEILNMLNDLLSYLRDVDHPIIKVVTILGQLEHESFSEIKKLCERYHQKVVIVEQASGSEETDKFFVHNLMDEHSKKLFLEREQQIILETVTPLKSIIYEDDDLGLFLNVLKLCQQPEQLERYDSITKCFEDIVPWYINREFLPLNSPLDESGGLERVYSSRLFDKETYRISDIEDHLEGYGKDDFVKMKNSLNPLYEETQHPPGFWEDENDKKVCIFLNEAGAGKTTYFTFLAWNLSTNDQSLYVIKLIALEYSTDFERLKASGIEDWSDDQMLRFLYRLIHLALFVPSVCRRTIEETDKHRAKADRCAEALSLLNGQIELNNSKTKQLTTEQVIELRLFGEKFNRKQLILILDGFDEIAPYYKDVVMKCFARFSHFDGIRKVYLSSRPYDLEDELKKSFPSCQMYRLKKFSERDVCMFLHKRLALNMDDYKHCNENQQLNFLVVLYDILIGILDDSATVPLFLDMAFVSLLPAIKEHVNFKTDTMSPKSLKSSKLDILQLVEQFVTRKMQILHTDKSGTTNAAASTPAAKTREKEEKKRITEKHMLLAMCTLFDSDDRGKLLSEQEEARVVELLKEVQEAEEKTGIICGVQGGKPQFVHRLFAEYFVACWLHQNWKRFKQEAVFRSEVIWGESMEKVREFFDRIIVRESKGCELHQAVLDGNKDLMREIIRNNPSAVTDKDQVGRLPSHVCVCGKNTSYLLNDLLKKFPLAFINQRDDLYGWNALDYAFVLLKRYTVKSLLEHKAELNVEILIQQLFSNDTENLIWLGCDYVEILHDCKQLDIANEISARVVEQLINERKVDIYAPRNILDGQSLLEHCASFEDGCMFLQLVRQIGTPLVQFLQHGLGDRLLEEAFNRKAYSVVKCLIEQCNISLPSLIDIQDLCAAVRHTIEENDFLWFEKLFQQLCRQMNVICTDVIEEEVHEPLGIDFDFDDDEDCCCIYSNEKLPFPKHDKYGTIDEKYIMGYLLAQAVHTGHVKIVSYIHQKTKMTVTNTLIKMFMVFLSKHVYTDHKKSIPAFQYLLNKTIDLWSVDDRGCNLLHFIAEKGCAYMLPCLIAKGFDPTEINPQNGWSGLHYLVSSEKSFWDKRFFRTFKWLLPYFDGYLKDFTAFESVFDCQIIEYWNRIQIVFPSLLERMLSKQDTESVRDALLAARENKRIDGGCPDTAWFAIYNNFIKRIPIL